MNNPSESDIARVLTGLLESQREEALATYTCLENTPALIAARGAVKSRDLEQYYYTYTWPLQNVVDGLVLSEQPKNERSASFLVSQYAFVEHHFGNIVKIVEGLPCYMDKTRSILRALARHLFDGSPIAFDRTQRYTYHLPVKVFLTETEITSFLNALHALYNGNPEIFIEMRNEQLSRKALDEPLLV